MGIRTFVVADGVRIAVVLVASTRTDLLTCSSGKEIPGSTVAVVRDRASVCTDAVGPARVPEAVVNVCAVDPVAGPTNWAVTA